MKLKKKHCGVLFDCANDLYLIHYSCESLSDCNQCYSPRITSIAVLHCESNATTSFSIHLSAERERIARADIGLYYDVLELEMLRDFINFVDAHPEAYFVHWHMSNINFGFEAIWHRYEVLSGEKHMQIPPERRINLPQVLKKAYGEDSFEKKHMMYKLMEVNGGRPQDTLDGVQEVQAFSSKEYLKMHKSTLAKVGWFRRTLRQAQNGKLVLNHSPMLHRLDMFLELRPVRLLSFLGIPSLLVGIVVKTLLP